MNCFAIIIIIHIQQIFLRKTGYYNGTLGDNKPFQWPGFRALYMFESIFVLQGTKITEYQVRTLFT